MDFYFIVCEQYDGLRFAVRNTLCSIQQEIDKCLQMWQSNIYKSVNIGSASFPIEDVICALISQSLGYIWISIVENFDPRVIP